MKVMIISGHFSADIGYMEVHLARAFSRLGHEVRVLTTTYVPTVVQTFKPRTYQAGLFKEEGYTVERLPLALRLKTVLVPKGCGKSIREFRPDLVVGIAIAKYMPVMALKWKQSLNYRYIAIFGDRHNDRHLPARSLGEKLDMWLQRLAFPLKRIWYSRVLSCADRIIFTVPETADFLRAQVPAARTPGVMQKMRFVPLGFDERHFYFDADARRKIRAAHAIGDSEMTMITATKVTPDKNIEVLIENFGDALRRCGSLRLFLIGLAKNDYSDSIRRKVESSVLADKVICLPFMSHEELRGYYSAADVGFWPREAISIQEAMGTGLLVLLKNDKIVGHLVTEGVNGFFLSQENGLAACLRKACAHSPRVADRLGERQRVVEFNQRFSYKRLAQQILDTLTDRVTEQVISTNQEDAGSVLMR